MDLNNNYKAEDFLSGKVPPDKGDMISDSEKELAKDISAAVKSVGNENLSSLESAELWNRIKNTTELQRPKSNWKLYLQIAALLFVISGIATWQYQRNTDTSKLLDFAAQNINKKIIAKQEQEGTPHKHPDRTVAVSPDEENIITTNDFNTLVVGDGQRSTIHLPDGTKVWLNSGSKLIYPTSFAKNSREVYLEGEAYFDVTHNKERPFYVRAKNMNIKVLGTEFYVSSNAESKRNYAVLVKGSIAFSTGNWLNKTERKLVPGEQIDFNPEENKLLISHVQTDNVQSWKEGYVNVSSEPLDEIIQRVAKYYHIEISTAGLDLSNEKFSGKLVFQRNADDVLSLLCNGTPYVYNSEERRLEIRKK
jgi:transmembrane sensor